MNLGSLEQLVAKGESETLEFKKSTAELRRAGETLCAFLNGEGGQVLIGVAPDGKPVGQQVSDATLRDTAAMLGRFEPPARIEMHRVEVGGGRTVIVLDAPSAREHAPFIFEGKAYRRVGSATTVMAQEEYGRLLLDRNHSRHRWENRPAVGVHLEDLDHEEILRTRQAAIERRRISASTSMSVGDILDRLGLRIDGKVTQAAQMLYGTRFLPDYPQGLLKLGRFRGASITGDILDNKQEHMHAFAMVREAIAWLDRTLPLSAHFPKGRIFREDRQPVPAEALREVILNAVMHRDYSRASSYVAIAVFDNRIEIRSVGNFPTGIHAEMLSGDHPSILRNPLIAGAFHRTGAVEVWGRGTNRVIEACEAQGVEPPEFSDQAGVVTVTFRAAVGPGATTGSSRYRVGTKSTAGPDLTERQRAILQVLGQKPAMPLREISAALKTPPSDRRLREELLRLKQMGLVEQSGHGRGSSWNRTSSHGE
jgi:ATP-dependent DNA helicase RecG